MNTKDENSQKENSKNHKTCQCIVCGKTFKTESYFQDMCPKCSKEYAELMAVFLD
jgi:hypothetical protein